jgi:hypothetical protein
VTATARSRPDFAILVYPAYLTPEKAETTVSPELTIRPETPPTFLVCFARFASFIKEIYEISIFRLNSC